MNMKKNSTPSESNGVVHLLGQNPKGQRLELFVLAGLCVTLMSFMYLVKDDYRTKVRQSFAKSEVGRSSIATSSPTFKPLTDLSSKINTNNLRVRGTIAAGVPIVFTPHAYSENVTYFLVAGGTRKELRGRSIRHTFSAPGHYAVKLIGYNSNGDLIEESRKEIHIRD